MSKKNKKQVLNRRKFLQGAGGVALGAAGLPYIMSCSGTGKTQTVATWTKLKSSKPMRLDSHTHIFYAKNQAYRPWNWDVIECMSEYVAEQGVTHFVALMRDKEFEKYAYRLDHECGARCIPFHWINVGKAQPDWPELPETFSLTGTAAGIKIHPRQTKSKDGSFFRATEETVGKVCDEAEKVGKPLLFHTDADEPNPCSVPMLAELAINHPDTNFIAAHLGVYGQEYYIKEYTPQEYAKIAEAAMKENLQLFLDTKNLYGDTAILGRCFPARSPDPDFRSKLLARTVGTFSAAARKTLIGKLFIGADYPCFYVADNPRSKYPYQVERMRAIFKEDFDETQMALNFISLLPEEFARKYL